MDPRTPAAVSAAGQPTVVGQVAWFEAPTSQGALKLAVVGDGGAVRHAADAALVLHACEPLLAGLDHWSAEPVEWKWRGTAGTAGGGIEAVARTWLVWRGGRAMLSCPLAWLRARGAPAPDWGAELTLPAVAATIVGARLHVPADALADLEVGGAVVVEPSFRPHWHGVLRACAEQDRDDGAGVVVALAGVADATPARPRFAPGLDIATALQPAGHPEDPLCELRLALPTPVAADGLAGWHDGPVGPAGPTASLWRSAAPGRPARPLAAGRLMPWGDGWALSIESVGDVDG